MNWGLVAKIGVPTLMLACIIVAILAFFDVPIGDDEPSLVVDEPGSAATHDPEATESFVEFARRGEPFAPEWLLRVTEVRWQSDGALWGFTTLPNDQRQQRTTIETFCEKLTDYVEASGQPFAGVSVRMAQDGAELHTRSNLDSSCLLPIPT